MSFIQFMATGAHSGREEARFQAVLITLKGHAGSRCTEQNCGIPGPESGLSVGPANRVTRWMSTRRCTSADMKTTGQQRLLVLPASQVGDLVMQFPYFHG
jgi:hypothetical protein